MGRKHAGGAPRRWRPSNALMAAVMAAVLAVGGLALFASPGQTKATDRYVALGDSYAVGTGASSAQDGYVAQLSRSMRGQGISDLTNVAVGGETTTTLIEGGQLDRALDAIDDSGSTTKAVTIDIGINELFTAECKRGVTEPECPARQDLATILSQLRDHLQGDDPEGRIYVVGLFTPFPSAPPAARKQVDTLLQGTDGRVDCAGKGEEIGLNDLLACVGARYGATFVGTRGTFALDPQRLIARDGLHPSDTGHAAIAELVQRAEASPKPVRNAGKLR